MIIKFNSHIQLNLFRLLHIATWLHIKQKYRNICLDAMDHDGRCSFVNKHRFLSSSMCIGSTSTNNRQIIRITYKEFFARSVIMFTSRYFIAQKIKLLYTEILVCYYRYQTPLSVFFCRITIGMTSVHND